MKRSAVLMKLLALGGLTLREIDAITGWPKKQVRRTIKNLMNQEKIFFIGVQCRGFYVVG